MARTRQMLPRLWLMTDERLGGLSPDDPLWRAVARLPRGAGIVLRHHGWPQKQRRQLAKALRQEAQRRGLVLVAARPRGLGRMDGVHWHRGAPAHRSGVITASAHNAREVRDAVRRGAMLVFLSPVFPTRSHPGAASLGPLRFGLIRRGIDAPVIALGGMDEQRWRRLLSLGADGFAAIDYWADFADCGRKIVSSACQPGMSPGEDGCLMARSPASIAASA
ncbi:MAG: thiamine phosphate synthase [Sphingomonadaceae bacterium]